MDATLLVPIGLGITVIGAALGISKFAAAAAEAIARQPEACLLYTSPSPRDNKASRMPSSA